MLFHNFPLLLLLLLLTPRPSSQSDGCSFNAVDTSASDTLQFFAFGTFSTFAANGTESWSTRDDVLAPQVITALAVKHFNDRNPIVLPEFAWIAPWCQIQLNFTLHNDQDSVARGMQVLLTSGMLFDVALGPLRFTTSEPIELALKSQYIPMISYAVSRENDDTEFVKTLPLDYALAVPVCEILAMKNYVTVGSVLPSDSFGLAFGVAFTTACENLGVKVLALYYDPKKTGEELRMSCMAAIANIKKEEIVATFVSSNIPDPFLELVYAIQTLGLSDRLWLHRVYETASLIKYWQTVDSPADLPDFFARSLIFDVSVPGNTPNTTNPAWDRLIDMYATANVGDVKSYMPTDLIRDEPFDLGEDFFVRTLGLARSRWAWAYDAIATVGLAACSSPRARYEELRSAMVNVTFNGASGPVQFLPDGSRLANETFVTMHFVVSTVNDTIETERFGIRTNQEWEIDWDLPDDVVPGLGLFPLPSLVPEATNNLPNWAVILGYIEFSLIFLIGAVVLVFVILFRREKIVMQSQPFFLINLDVGTMLIGCAIVPLSLFDTSSPGDSTLCMSIAFTYSLGLSLSLGAILLKYLRVADLWQYRRRSSLFYVGTLCLVFVIHCSILTIWTLTAPLIYQRTVTRYTRSHVAVESVGECVITDNGVFLGLSLTINAALVISTGLISSAVYSRVPEQFQEAKWTGIAAFTLGQVYFVAIPAIAATYMYPLPRFLVMANTCFLTALSLQLCVFLPKWLAWRARRDTFVTLKATDGTPRSSAAIKHACAADAPVPVLDGIATTGPSVPGSQGGGGGEDHQKRDSPLRQNSNGNKKHSSGNIGRVTPTEIDGGKGWGGSGGILRTFADIALPPGLSAIEISIIRNEDTIAAAAARSSTNGRSHHEHNHSKGISSFADLPLDGDDEDEIGALTLV